MGISCELEFIKEDLFAVSLDDESEPIGETLAAKFSVNYTKLRNVMEAVDK